MKAASSSFVALIPARGDHVGSSALGTRRAMRVTVGRQTASVRRQCHRQRMKKRRTAAGKSRGNEK